MPIGPISMVWYVAIVAVLNLALGYGLAVYMGAGRPRYVLTSGSNDDSTSDFSDD
jgi:hypothetical protein